MSSYLVTGATRGIGLGFVSQLSSNPSNTVIALIRSLSTAGPLQDLAKERGNIHIVVTDLAEPVILATAAKEVEGVTGGALDVLILNAGSTTGPETSGLNVGAFHGKEDLLEQEIGHNIKANLLSNIHTIHAFLPLIRQSTNAAQKKIIFISSQSGDVEFTRITGMANLVGYSVAKAGMNMVMTKLGVELAAEGIKTLSMSPGWVDTDAAKAVTGDPDVRRFVLDAFHKLDPMVEGPAPVADAVAHMLKVVESLAEEDSGKFLTHHGDEKTWF